ncbi:MAG TPA: DUF1552 domain-containing protein [Humisphaera sp.]|jgi:hypothetical protein|nr:DUF1552 domain-containing protein [Humisphaera sp.]
MNVPHISTVRPLDRRRFLKCAGVMLALPWLDAMTPAFAQERGVQSAPPPRRFVGMMTNMGIMPEFFFPATPGRDYESTPYLEILKEHRADMTVFSGVSLPGVDGGHASEKSFLTGAPGASRGTFRNSISLDQVMAEKVGGSTRLPSLALMIGTENLSLSWTRSGSMIPPVISPVKLYQQLFVEDTPQAKAVAVQRLKEDRSLLDTLREKARRLESEVGAADRDRLDQYFTSVRELERRLATAEGWIGKPKPKVTAAKPEELTDRNDLPKNNRVMFDLVRLALETDSTRVVTIAASVGSITPRTIPGVKSNTHELTHHGHREEKVSELRRIEEAQFRDLATFLTELRQVSEQGITLLDQTAVLYGTNMGSANSHSNDNLPALLAGGGFKHGQHLAFDTKNNYPLTNLHVSLLQRLGIEAAGFSSGTSTMRGLEMA